MTKLKKYKMFIDGEWVESESKKTFETLNPETNKPWATVPEASTKDVDRAVKAAQKAFDGEWPKLLPRERGKFLRAIGNQLRENSEMLGEIETIDTGKLFRETKKQANYIAEYYDYYAGLADKVEGTVLPIDKPNIQAITTRIPIGVIAAIVPWNSQMFLTATKLAPALAAGCTLVLKPAELTPLTALYFGHLIEKSGIPKGVVNIVTGLGETAGDALAKHKDVDKITFTGSTEVGKKIVSSSVGNLKKVTLELGGKSPVVIFKDADLEKTVPGVARACFFLQGQNCMAGTRVFVHEDIHDELVQGVKEMAESFQIGHGLIESNDFGPLISENQRNRVLKYIEQGMAEGANLVYGGKKINEKGFFIQPTIFTEVTGEMKIAKEEIFGPVLSIEKFGNESLEEIAKRANSTTYGLSGSVWTNDISIGHRMAALIDSGQVSINCHAAVDSAIPFGGNKQSGWGREFGEEGLDSYLKTKATTIMY